MTSEPTPGARTGSPADDAEQNDAPTTSQPARSPREGAADVVPLAPGRAGGDTAKPLAKPPAGKAAAPGRSKKAGAKRSVGKQLAELPALILLAFLIAIVIKTFLAQAFFIPSESMVPTLRIGDRVLVEKLGYRFGDPSRGDVVVFQRPNGLRAPDLPWYDDARNYMRELLGLPTGLGEDYIKRVVAVGGDTITYRDTPRVLTVNGEKVTEPYLRGKDRGSQSITPQTCKGMQLERRDDACLVPAGTIFVMGDNRGNSSDSRVIGPVGTDKIVGRAVAIIWPAGDIGGL